MYCIVVSTITVKSVCSEYILDEEERVMNGTLLPVSDFCKIRSQVA